MHDKSGCPAVPFLLFKSAARVFCRYCSIGSLALLEKCLPRLQASLDCAQLRTSCCPKVPADTGISISRSGLPEQELHCPCRTACIQIMSADSVFCHQSCAHSPHAFLDSSTFNTVIKQQLPHPCFAVALQHATAVRGSCKGTQKCVIP